MPLSIDWAGLTAVNPDITGWILVEALPQVSFPVVQGPDDAYYVNRTYDGQTSGSGCIFMSCLCSRDFSSPHTPIYGHNMNNGTMFSPLYTHRADDTFRRNPYIWILTPQGAYCYKVFSVFETARSSDAFAVFLTRGRAFLEHAYGLMARGQFYRDTEVLLTEESRIISLVSCVPSTYNRTVISAVCVSARQPGE
ncbi:MAG: class B sortase [Lachnospiraceae bacterium]|nr:class B sortase [Lachnospiraceae bacterium]